MWLFEWVEDSFINTLIVGKDKVLPEVENKNQKTEIDNKMIKKSKRQLGDYQKLLLKLQFICEFFMVVVVVLFVMCVKEHFDTFVMLWLMCCSLIATKCHRVMFSVLLMN